MRYPRPSTPVLAILGRGYVSEWPLHWQCLCYVAVSNRKRREVEILHASEGLRAFVTLSIASKMPPKRQYRKKAPAKKVVAVAKKAVTRERQKKVELKDRVSTSIPPFFQGATMYQNGPDVAPIVPGPTNGPSNVLTIVSPRS